MRRNRFVLSMLVLLAVASAVLIWQFGLRHASAASVQPDVASLALLPQQTSAVFGVDLDGLRSTYTFAQWKQREATKPRDEHYDDFVSQTGFDPFRDIQAITGGAWKNGDEPAFLAVITARYNATAVADYMRQKGAAISTYKGVTLAGPNPHENKHGHGDGLLAFVDDHTILAGSLAGVQYAIDQRQAGGQNAFANQALLARVQQIGADNQVWAVSLSPGTFIGNLAAGATGPQANIVRILSGLQASTFALNASSGLNVVAQGTCANDADARALADAARGLIAMGKLAAPANRPEALQLLDSVVVEQHGADVKVAAQLPSDLLDRLHEQRGLFMNPDRPHHHRQ